MSWDSIFDDCLIVSLMRARAHTHTLTPTHTSALGTRVRAHTHTHTRTHQHRVNGHAPGGALVQGAHIIHTLYVHLCTFYVPCGSHPCLYMYVCTPTQMCAHTCTCMAVAVPVTMAEGRVVEGFHLVARSAFSTSRTPTGFRLQDAGVERGRFRRDFLTISS